MKLFITKSLLMALLFTVLSTFSNGQIAGGLGPLINDGEGNGNGIYVTYCLNEFGEADISVEIRLANLEEHMETGDFYIPSELPEMSLRYAVGEESGIISLDQTAFSQALDVNDIPTFKALIDLDPIDLSSQCEIALPGEVLPVLLHIELVHDNDETVVLYPACEHSAIYEIFSCGVFEFAGGCGTGTGDPDPISGLHGNADRPTVQNPINSANNREEGGDCNNTGLAAFLDYFSFECDCGPGEIQVEDRGDTGGAEKHLLNVAVNPNPFTRNMEINWSAQSTIESMYLYDANGKVIKAWNKSQVNNSTQVNFDTESLSRGLYFLKASSVDTTEIIKVVKQ